MKSSLRNYFHISIPKAIGSKIKTSLFVSQPKGIFEMCHSAVKNQRKSCHAHRHKNLYRLLRTYFKFNRYSCNSPNGNYIPTSTILLFER